MTASRRIGGLVPIVNIQLGEVIFGGVGSGLYGMLLFAIVAVFIAGLMVGRTPEYLGKKIEAEGGQDGHAGDADPAAVDPRLHGAAAVLPAGSGGPGNRDRMASARSSTPITSGTGNNGSAFAGLSANTPFYNTTLGFAMLIGRFSDHRADPGDRRLAGAEETGAAVGRNLPDAPAAVRRSADRRDPDHRRPDLLPGAVRSAPSSSTCRCTHGTPLLTALRDRTAILARDIRR